MPSLPVSDIQHQGYDGTRPIEITSKRRTILSPARTSRDSTTVEVYKQKPIPDEDELAFSVVFSSHAIGRAIGLEAQVARYVRLFDSSFLSRAVQTTSFLEVQLQQRDVYQRLIVLLKENLQKFSFMEYIEYEDVLGGLVIDAYREKERITCVVSTKSTQVLSYVNDEITSREFTREERSILAVVNYVRTLLE